jgi:hypothetical protein
MVLLAGVVLDVLLVLAGGGRLGRLGELRLRSTGLIFAAVALQLVAFPTGLAPWAPGDRVATWMSFGSYALLAVATVRNRRLPGMPVLALGMSLNVITMLANGGHMPATGWALRTAGLVEHGVHDNSVALADPALWPLVDRFAVPSVVPVAGVFSVGDVLIVAGVAVLLWRAGGARPPWRRAQATRVAPE